MGNFTGIAGFYNPLLPKEKEDRIGLQLERVKYWLSQGAQPTTRDARILAEKTLVGSYYGGTDVSSDFHKLLRLYKQGQLDLEGMITRRIKIDEINPALEAVRNGEVIRQVIEF